MENVTIVLSGLNKEQIKVLKQAVARLEYLENQKKAEKKPIEFEKWFTAILPIPDPENFEVFTNYLVYETTRDNCASVYGVNYSHVINQNKYFICFCGNDLVALNQCIANTFYNLNNA